MTVALEPIAIVGMGCMFPGAPDLATYWANVRDGIDAITEIPSTHFDVDDYYDADPHAPDRIYSRRGGFLQPVEFDALRWGLAPRDIEATDTTHLLGLMVAEAALKDAGYLVGNRVPPRERTSVILGVTGALELVVPLGARLGHPHWRRALAASGVAPDTAEDVVRRISAAYVPWQENSFPGLLGNVAAGRIANRLDLHGTNCVVDAACASSLAAVHLGLLELRSYQSDVVLAGGFDTFNDIFMYMCFSKTPALSPSGDARPFDRDGDGTVLGEGLGALVLKRQSDAIRDGDRIYAVIRGMGSSSDGRGQAIYSPAIEGQVRALERAYQPANVAPRTVELIEGHGTGTRVGDSTEVAALTRVFGDAEPDRPWCTLGSVKSMIGHTKAAAGAAGLIKAALALYHATLPPTLKVLHPSEALASPTAPFCLSPTKRPWIASDEHPRRAGVSAFGFGGSNFHCVLEEGPSPHRPDWDGRLQLLALSGDSPEALAEGIEALARGETWAEFRIAAADARARFDAQARCRIAWLVRREDSRDERVAKAKQRLAEIGSRPAGVAIESAVAFADGPATTGFAVLFPGQGAQYVDMLRDLACRFEAVAQTISAASRVTPGIAEAIFPPPRIDDSSVTKVRLDPLARTDMAQPALGAIELGAWNLLTEFGLRPTAAAGHSFGEWVALAAAGRLQPDDFHRLARRRGEHMARVGGADPGSMLAVRMPLTELSRWLHERKSPLVLANRNAPSQGVLSGPRSAIDAAELTLREQGVPCLRLNVAAAFHSPLVAQAADDLAVDLADVRLAPGRFPVYGNTLASPYPLDEDEAKAWLAAQLARPVDFEQTLRRMDADGIRVFVEVGPGRRLQGLVRDTLPNRNVVVTSLDASNGKGDGLEDLGHLLATLAVVGIPVDLTRWDPEPPRLAQEAPRFAIEICGANRRPHRSTTPEPQTSRSSPSTSAYSASAYSASAYSAPAYSAPAYSPSASTMPFERTDDVQNHPPATSVNGVSERNPPNVERSVGDEVMDRLLRLAEQTAALHRQFLDHQAEATRIFERWLTRQDGSAPSGSAPPGSAPPGSAQTGSRTASAPPAPPPVPDVAAINGVRHRPVAGPFVPAPKAKPIEVPPRTPGVSSTPAPQVAPIRVTSSPRPQAPLDGPSRVAEVVLSVVAQKTGYPTAMLGLEMGLDSDLGIDSIKRVEILSALQEALPHAPTVGPDRLGELKTLAELARFLEGDAPVIPSPVQGIAETLLGIVAAKTGYPVGMLGLEMGFDADLGIDSIKRVEILSAVQEALPQAPTIGPDHLASLQTLGEVAQFLAGGAPPRNGVSRISSLTPERVGATANGSPSSVRTEPAGRPELDVYGLERVRFPLTDPPDRFGPSGVILVTRTKDGLGEALTRELEARDLRARTIDLDDIGDQSEVSIGGLVLVAPNGGSSVEWLQRALFATRDRSASLRRGLIAAVTRLGGSFGIAGVGVESSASGGALCGLIKTVALEWPDAHARSLDLPHELDLSHHVGSIVDGLLARGPVELGFDGEGFSRLALQPIEDPPSPTFHLGSRDVVLATGGARGVTAAVLESFARAGAGTFVLLGRTPIDGAEPEWLRDVTDEAAIKRTLLEVGAVESTPRAVEHAYAEILAKREIRRTLAALERLGSRAIYLAVDVQDAAAVRQALASLGGDVGACTVLVHGAGVIADRRIEDKRDDAVARVLGTKLRGFEHLLAALPREPLRAIVLFSSSTARFGRIGQSDYAMANEGLNKVAQSLARSLPSTTRVLSVGWGPWDGGMVTPSLQKVFAAEGVRPIPLHAGGPALLRALGRPGPVEIVVLGSGSAVPTSDRSPDVDRPVVFQRTLSLSTHPILVDHVIGGRAVLPIALCLEWLAHAALHGNPGFRFIGLDDLEVVRGIRIGERERLNLTFGCGPIASSSGQVRVPVRAQLEGRSTPSFRATVVLGSGDDVGAPPEANGLAHEPGGTQIDPYRDGLLFHGHRFHALQGEVSASRWHVRARCRSAPRPETWMSDPVRRRWIADPWVIDAGLQAAIVWSQTQLGKPCLPARFDRYRQSVARFPDEPIELRLTVTEQASTKVVCAIEWTTLGGERLAQMEGLTSFADAGLVDAFRARRLATSPPLPLGGMP